MSEAYVHGYDPQENLRLQDQASTLVELLHCDTAYPAGHRVLEAGCGVGAQTVTLAKNSPKASILSIDISEASLIEAKRNVEAAGLTNIPFQKRDIFHLSFESISFQDRVMENSFLRVFIWAFRRAMIDECICETRDSDKSSVAPISFMVISS